MYWSHSICTEGFTNLDLTLHASVHGLMCSAPFVVKAVLPGQAAALTGISPGDYLLEVRPRADGGSGGGGGEVVDLLQAALINLWWPKFSPTFRCHALAQGMAVAISWEASMQALTLIRG